MTKIVPINALDMSLATAIDMVLPLNNDVTHPHIAARIIVCKAAAEGAPLINMLWDEMIRLYGKGRPLDGSMTDLRKRVERFQAEAKAK